MKIAIILGTRPEIIKLSPIIDICRKQRVKHFIVHTNQHYSPDMDSIFFKELGLLKPKYNLHVKERYHGKMTGKMIAGIERVLQKEKPDWVLVEGDTNTVLAGALAATKLGIKVGHVEAGLRSYDRTMPEEVNRILVDHISDALFCPTKKQFHISTKEGISRTKLLVTGNTIVDAVYHGRKILEKRKLFRHYNEQRFALLTMHRPANVDNPKMLLQVLEAIRSAAIRNKLEVYFPVHPRTGKNLKRFNIHLDRKVFKLLKPVGFLEMLALEKHAAVVLTDSGGIQEEACILGVPCVTLRENTERPETVEVGSNILVGSNQKKIEKAIANSLKGKQAWKNPFGDGLSAKRILDHIVR